MRRKWNIKAVLLLLWCIVLTQGCSNTTMLTQDEIVDIANKEFKTQDPEHYESEIYYDVNHVEWKETLATMKKDSPDFAERFKVLDGRDYQVVIYSPKDPPTGSICLGGGFWVFVDSKTGEVITWFGEK